MFSLVIIHITSKNLLTYLICRKIEKYLWKITRLKFIVGFNIIKNPRFEKIYFGNFLTDFQMVDNLNGLANIPRLKKFSNQKSSLKIFPVPVAKLKKPLPKRTTSAVRRNGVGLDVRDRNHKEGSRLKQKWKTIRQIRRRLVQSVSTEYFLSLIDKK